MVSRQESGVGSKQRRRTPHFQHSSWEAVRTFGQPRRAAVGGVLGSHGAARRVRRDSRRAAPCSCRATAYIMLAVALQRRRHHHGDLGRVVVIGQRGAAPGPDLPYRRGWRSAKRAARPARWRCACLLRRAGGGACGAAIPGTASAADSVGGAGGAGGGGLASGSARTSKSTRQSSAEPAGAAAAVRAPHRLRRPPGAAWLVEKRCRRRPDSSVGWHPNRSQPDFK